MKWLHDSTECIVSTTIVVVMFLLSGCATKHTPLRAYEGPDLPESEVAKINTASIRHDFGEITVLELDGKQYNYDNLLVLPGQHDIRVGIRSGQAAQVQAGLLPTLIWDNIINKWDIILRCNTEAGKSYTIFGELIKDPDGQKIGWLGHGKWVYWLEEPQSGNVVCGKHPIESETFVNDNRSLKQHDYSMKHDKMAAD